MNKTTIVTRRFEFDAGHRVLGHGGKCQHLHGHRYVADVSVSAVNLDDLSMVIDFSVIKEKVGQFIDVAWDHNLLLNKEDPVLRVLAQTELKPPFLFNGNPTAENIAKELYTCATFVLKNHNIKIERVRIYETPNCWADYPHGPD